jgi:hypothetical protein
VDISLGERDSLAHEPHPKHAPWWSRFFRLGR